MHLLTRFAAALIVVIAITGCSYYTGERTEHYNGSQFYNPEPMRETSFMGFLKWQFTREQAKWPDELPTRQPGKPVARVTGDELVITMVGHATVLIQTAGLNILTDPIWSERASPLSVFGPVRRKPPGIAYADLPKIDVIVISHNHFDHMDLPTLKVLWERDQPKIIVPLGNDTILMDNIAGIEAVAVDWGQSVEVGPEVRVIATPVQHWSRRGAFDQNKALWAGYLIDAPGGNIFFSGDTGLGTGWWVDEVKTLARQPIRMALLPIGAFLPRWFMAPVHIDARQAVDIFRKLEAHAALGIHWGTFPMADDGPTQALAELQAARASIGIAPDVFRTLEPGASWVVK